MWPLVRCIASAISNWPRVCRSSSGAACPTTSCSTSPSVGTSRIRPCSTVRCDACSPIAGRRRWSDNFAGQWLLPAEPSQPEARLRTSFPISTKASASRSSGKPSSSLDSQLREDRSVVELLSANYTFVNERLARHYGIPNIYGRNFRRVTFSGDVASRRPAGTGQSADRDVIPQPDLAGAARQMGARQPSGNASTGSAARRPNLKERGDDGKPASVRARLEAHRKNASCAACHAPMDPLGFALENFDAIGKWRTTSEARYPDRCVGGVSWRRDVRGPGGAASVPAESSRSVRRDRH